MPPDPISIATASQIAADYLRVSSGTTGTQVSGTWHQLQTNATGSVYWQPIVVAREQEREAMTRDEARAQYMRLTSGGGRGLAAEDWDVLERACTLLEMTPPPRPHGVRPRNARRSVEDYPTAEQVKLYHTLD